MFINIVLQMLLVGNATGNIFEKQKVIDIHYAYCMYYTSIHVYVHSVLSALTSEIN